MLPKRVIACLDVEAGRTVKGIGFADLRDMGDPVELARRYESQGADELVFLDITATEEDRSTMVDVVRRVAADIFIPFTVGGGVRNETDVQRLLDAGADKVAVNSAALADPSLLNRLAKRFGRQCITLAIDAKRGTDNWQVYVAGGKVPTDKDAVMWAQEAAERGAGEVLLTSIDRDGTGAGYDLDLIGAVNRVVTVPVIASGGAGQLRHYKDVICDAGADAVLAASRLHSEQMSVGDIKSHLATASVPVRPVQPDRRSDYESQVMPTEHPRLAIVDYGIGNRYSVQQALRYVGADAQITADPKELESATGIVLPGVGAFAPAMESLRERGLDSELRRLARLGKPVLGICLGEQLLLSGSEEDGWHGGLNLISGEVHEIRTPTKPNTGWRMVRMNIRDALLSGLVRTDYGAPAEADLGYFYHVHQYAAEPNSFNSVVGWTKLKEPAFGDKVYDFQVASIVRNELSRRIYGVQFHPEKSGWTGLSLLAGFVQICQSEATKI